MISDRFFDLKQLAAVAINYPLTEYVGMVVSLQAEGQNVCSIIPGVALAITSGETTTCEDFLPAVFGGHTPLAINDNLLSLLSHSIKRAGLGIWKPTLAVDFLFAALMEWNQQKLFRQLSFGWSFFPVAAFGSGEVIGSWEWHCTRIEQWRRQIFLQS